MRHDMAPDWTPLFVSFVVRLGSKRSCTSAGGVVKLTSEMIGRVTSHVKICSLEAVCNPISPISLHMRFDHNAMPMYMILREPRVSARCEGAADTREPKVYISRFPVQALAHLFMSYIETVTLKRLAHWYLPWIYHQNRTRTIRQHCTSRW